MGLYMLAFVLNYEDRFEEAIDNADEALRLSPDPLDRVCARGARGAALALMGRSQEGLKDLLAARDEMVAGDFLFPLVGVDVPYGVALVMVGKLAAGVRWIEDAIGRFEAWGNETQPAFGRLILGEVYLQMALGKEKPPLGVILRNLGFVLRTLPVAARKARHNLEEAVQRTRDTDMPGFLARGLLDLGQLYEATGHIEEARMHLEEARQIAEPLESSALDGKIRSPLESLARQDAC